MNFFGFLKLLVCKVNLCKQFSSALRLPIIHQQQQKHQLQQKDFRKDFKTISSTEKHLSPTCNSSSTESKDQDKRD